jgi:diadenylate cyclase
MVVGIVVITLFYFISKQFDLLTLHWLLRTFLNSIFLIIIIVFQRDIRRVLTQVGKTPFQKQYDMVAVELNEVVKGAFHMAKRRIGALIVIERDTGLRDYIESGHLIDAKLTRELIISIFLPLSPIHDGGIIVRNGRIHSAGCLLPLSKRPDLDKRYGTRHRAAIGLSEDTDAVIIVVSEESQEVSIAQYGQITHVPDEETLTSRLHKIFITSDTNSYSRKNWFSWAQRS